MRLYVPAVASGAAVRVGTHGQQGVLLDLELPVQRLALPEHRAGRLLLNGAAEEPLGWGSS